jgi:hypothetical protein
MEGRSRQSIASNLGWGASLVVLLGLLIHQVAQPRPSGLKPEPVTPKAAGAPLIERGQDRPEISVEVGPFLRVRAKKTSTPPYLRPIAQFLGVTADQLVEGKRAAEPRNAHSQLSVKEDLPGTTDTATEASKWVQRWGPQILACQPEFMIALVPDPERSQSAYRFDLWVEALQRACNAIDPERKSDVFVLDHYYLPWEHLTDEPSRDAHEPERVPGVLVFRSTPSPDQLSKPSGTPTGMAGGNLAGSPSVRTLIVFLIGESPVAGIQKPALRTALEIVAWFEMERCFGSKTIQDNSREKHTPAVRIVGPVFSGSQLSLQVALQAWWSDHEGDFRDCYNDWKINVVSTATALRIDDFQPSHVLPNGRSFLKPPPRKGNVTLASTLLPDTALIDRLFQFIRGMHGTEKIVVGHLREGSTSYGTDCVLPKHDNFQIIEVPFPLHISRVHANRAQASLRDAENLPQFSAFDRGLRIPIPAAEGEADTILEQDALLTPIYQDIVLTSALQTLASQHPQYVLITATDRRDKIFLASAVSRHCPDARLVLTYSDQLYTHTDYVRYLGGTLVVSCYPISPVTTALRADDGRQHPPLQIDSFAEHNVYGYFNAVAAQLGKVRAMAFYQWPMATREQPLLRSELPKETSHPGPSVWISQVGPDHADVVNLDPPDGGSGYVWAPKPIGGSPPLSPYSGDALAAVLLLPSTTPAWPICVGAVAIAVLIVAVYGLQIITGVCKAFPPFDPNKGWPERDLREADVAKSCTRARMYFCSHLIALAIFSGLLGYLTAVEFDRLFSEAVRHLSLWDRIGPALIIVIAADAGFVGLVSYEVTSWLRVGTSTEAPSRSSAQLGTWADWKGKWSELRSRPAREISRVAKQYSKFNLSFPFSFSARATVAFLSGSCGVMPAVAGAWFAPSVDNPWRIAKIMDVGCWNSPVVPLIFIAAIGLVWCWLQASRLLLLNNIEIQWEPLEAYSLEGISAKIGHNWITRKIESVIDQHRALGKSCSTWFSLPAFLRRADQSKRPRFQINWYLLAAAVVFLYGAFDARAKWQDGPDGRIVTFLRYGIAACWLLLCLEVGRLWEFWKRLKDLHHAVARLPMQKVFATLPDYFVRAYGDLFFVERYRDLSSPALVQQLQWVLKKRQELHALYPRQALFASDVEPAPFALSDLLNALKDPRGKGAGEVDPAVRPSSESRQSPEAPVEGSATHDTTAHVQDGATLHASPRKSGSWVRQYCLFALPEIAHTWSERQAGDGYASASEVAGSDQTQADITDQVELPGSPATPRDSKAVGEQKRMLTLADEKLLAMTIVAYFSQYRLQLMGIAVFLGLAPIALLGAVASYSFIPQRDLMNATAALAVICLVLLATIYTGLNSDEFLSRITGTAQRRLAFNADSITTFLILLLPLTLTIASRLAGGEIMYGWLSSLVGGISSR